MNWPMRKAMGGRLQGAGERCWVALALWFAALLGNSVQAAPHPSHLRDAAEARKLIARNGGSLLFSWSAPVDFRQTSALTLRTEPEPGRGWMEKAVRFSGWPNGQSMQWSASHRPTTKDRWPAGYIDASLGFGSTAGWVFDLPGKRLEGLSDLFLVATSLGEGTSLTLNRISLNGRPLGDSLEASNRVRGGQDVLRLRGASLQRGFDMRGELRVRWPRGKKPRGGHLSLELWGARVFEEDREAPRVAIERPVSNILINGVPRFRAIYSDEGSGIDPGSVELWLDGHELTAYAEVGPESVELNAFGAVGSGDRSLVVYVSDRAGNEGRGEVSFNVDSIPPRLGCSRPEVPSPTNPPPPLQISFYDGESGVDIATLRVLIDGIALAGPCEVEEDAATCPVPFLEAGLHDVEVQVRDRVGNLGVRRERVGAAVAPR